VDVIDQNCTEALEIALCVRLENVFMHVICIWSTAFCGSSGISHSDV